MNRNIFVFRLSNELFSLALSELKAILLSDAMELKIGDRIDEFLFIYTDTKTALNICDRASLVIEMGSLIDIVDESDVAEIIRVVKDLQHEVDICIFLDSVRGFGKEYIKQFLNAYNLRHKLWRRCSKSLKISFVNGIAIVYEVLYRRRQLKFEEREPQKRPCYRPGTMKPQLARTLVNLSRVSPRLKHLLLDPFCGVGGIVLEACSMNIPALCSDLDVKMCLCAKKNIEHFYCDNKVDILIADATRNGLRGYTADAIVTDPPYGIQSIPVGTSLVNLVKEFIAISSDVIKSGRCMVFAVPIELEVKVDKLLTNYGFEIEEKHLNMVHGSLTRVIYVAVRL